MASNNNNFLARRQFFPAFTVFGCLLLLYSTTPLFHSSVPFASAQPQQEASADGAMALDPSGNERQSKFFGVRKNAEDSPEADGNAAQRRRPLLSERNKGLDVQLTILLSVALLAALLLVIVSIILVVRHKVKKRRALLMEKIRRQQEFLFAWEQANYEKVEEDLSQISSLEVLPLAGGPSTSRARVRKQSALMPDDFTLRSGFDSFASGRNNNPHDEDGFNLQQQQNTTQALSSLEQTASRQTMRTQSGPVLPPSKPATVTAIGQPQKMGTATAWINAGPEPKSAKSKSFHPSFSFPTKDDRGTSKTDDKSLGYFIASQSVPTKSDTTTMPTEPSSTLSSSADSESSSSQSSKAEKAKKKAKKRAQK